MPRSIRTLTLLSALAVASCSTSPTGPPSGLPVTMAASFDVTPAPVVAASGDSVYVTVASNAITAGCGGVTLDAGLVGNTLVMTVGQLELADVCPATLLLLSASSRIAVHHVPSGHYTVKLNRLHVRPRGVTEQEVTRGDVVVP